MKTKGSRQCSCEHPAAASQPSLFRLFLLIVVQKQSTEPSVFSTGVIVLYIHVYLRLLMEGASSASSYVTAILDMLVIGYLVN